MSGARRGPRKLGGAFEKVVAQSAPQTLLAEMQSAWPEACGAVLLSEADTLQPASASATTAKASRRAYFFPQNPISVRIPPR